MTLERNGLRWTADEDAMLRELSAEGIGPVAIAERMHRKPDGVRSRASNIGARFAKRQGTLDDGEIEALRKLAAAGYTLASAATKLRRCPKVLSRNMPALGIQFLPSKASIKWGDGRAEEAMSLWLSGMSGLDIADRLGHGLTRSSVIAYMHRNGIKRPQSMDSRRAYGKRAAKTFNRAHPKPPIVRPRKAKNNNPSGFKGIHLKDIRYHYVGYRNSKGQPLPEASGVARISHADLERKHCRWIVGDPEEIGANAPLFCGEPRHAHLPYCAGHCRRAYRPA